MPVDLTNAQAAITAFFHTNSAVILRPTNTNDHGTVTQVLTEVETTTCHAIEPRFVPATTPANSEELGEQPKRYLTFPYGTDVRKDDRVDTLGRRYRVVRAEPPPQFALETQVGVVDVTGES